MPTSTYEIVTQTVTLGTSTGRDTFTLSAPSGKKPLSGGVEPLYSYGSTGAGTTLSYPSGQDWVFTIEHGSCNPNTQVKLYLVCAGL